MWPYTCREDSSTEKDISIKKILITVLYKIILIKKWVFLQNLVILIILHYALKISHSGHQISAPLDNSQLSSLLLESKEMQLYLFNQPVDWIIQLNLPRYPAAPQNFLLPRIQIYKKKSPNFFQTGSSCNPSEDLPYSLLFTQLF